jgi:hypothetical protein
LTLLEKLTTWGNIVDPEKENKQYSDQLGAKKDNQMMESMNEHIQIIWGAMLFKDSP